MHANRLNPENKGDIHNVLRTPRRRCKVPADRAYYIILYPSQSRSTPSYRTVYTHTHTHTHTATLCSTRRQHFPSIQVTRGWVISKAVRVYMRRLHDFLQCFGAVGWAAGKGIRPVKKVSDRVLVWLSVWSDMQTCTMYTVSQKKTRHQTLAHNFTKY